MSTVDVRRRCLLAIGLFLLAPLIGEYVLGNTPITALPELPLYAPMYGGGALLVREVARRARAGWPTVIGLGAAYALVEEGLIDQMVVNPAYLGLDSFAGKAPVPGLGISAQLVYESLSIHTVWSVGVSIAVVEAFDRTEPRPWLGRIGLGAVAVLFVAGSAALALMQYDEFRFVASPLQFAVLGSTITVLVVLALTVLRRSRPCPPPAAPAAPRPRAAGAAAFGIGLLYWVHDLVVPAVAGAWIAVAGWAVLAVVAGALLIRTSARPGWGPAHRLAVAGGALLTYLVVAPVNSWAAGVPLPVGLLGNAVFGAVAVAVLACAARRSAGCPRREVPTSAGAASCRDHRRC